MGQIHMKHRTDWDPEVFKKKKAKSLKFESHILLIQTILNNNQQQQQLQTQNSNNFFKPHMLLHSDHNNSNQKFVPFQLMTKKTGEVTLK